MHIVHAASKWICGKYPDGTLMVARYLVCGKYLDMREFVEGGVHMGRS